VNSTAASGKITAGWVNSRFFTESVDKGENSLYAMLHLVMSVKFVTSTDSDERLLEAICLKNASAMETLYKRHSRAAFSFAYRKVGDEALADEVVNDAMMQVWRSASTFSNKSSVKTWIFGIAKNKCLDVLRSRGKALWREAELSDDEIKQLEDPTPGAYTLLLSKQKGHHLVECFEQLSAEQQSCLHLFIVEGMSLAEISQTLEVPTNTVATRIHYARRKLREKLEGIFGKEDV
jgi:RNA polymerase sigma-70 factor, ECF subfamily